MDVNGALLVPERQKQGVWVHGYVQDARNLPFALNADALQELRALLVSCIYFAAPAHIQSCITEMFRVRSVPGADIGRGLCMLYARTTAAWTPHSVTHQQAGVLTFPEHADRVAFFLSPLDSCRWHGRWTARPDLDSSAVHLCEGACGHPVATYTGVCSGMLMKLFRSAGGSARKHPCAEVVGLPRSQHGVFGSSVLCNLVQAQRPANAFCKT